ncbi:MAG: heme exporter protein CcmD [Candidatus Muproteobacteria bacterium RBG_16_60_9]|uniref:Heme exporter protein D n=1 Tax=Candidatus Muproteobacteria bacterium RBG_16_60_9 TaxID=1817755 RepID=A0A1F6UVX0_9PROT|nr:MAG: heme exporter protein CcmD [Candidatus Muproteobacteria bacterium RBG_16_60_9]
MGQYGSYILVAYALGAVVLIINVILPMRRRKTVRARLREFYRAQEQSR